MFIYFSIYLMNWCYIVRIFLFDILDIIVLIVLYIDSFVLEILYIWKKKGFELFNEKFMYYLGLINYIIL